MMNFAGTSRKTTRDERGKGIAEVPSIPSQRRRVELEVPDLGVPVGDFLQSPEKRAPATQRTEQDSLTIAYAMALDKIEQLLVQKAAWIHERATLVSENENLRSQNLERSGRASFTVGRSNPTTAKVDVTMTLQIPLAPLSIADNAARGEAYAVRDRTVTQGGARRSGTNVPAP